MSSHEPNENRAGVPKRQRWSRAERRHQLLDISRRLIREEGSDALTLGRLAEEAGVTKPVVYDHFCTRSHLLVVLYQEFETRQDALMTASLEACEPTLTDLARVIARSYVDCVLTQGREIPGVSCALAGSPELDSIKRESTAAFMEQCRCALAPFAKSGDIAPAGLWAMIGAAESLSYAAAAGEITAEQAQSELFETVVGIVKRSV